MRIVFLGQSSKLGTLGARNMSGSISYAAAVSTPSGTLRQPQIQARACSDPDLHASFDESNANTKPQRPGAGMRSKTSFRGWSSKRLGKSFDSQPGPVKEVKQPGRSVREGHKPNTSHEEEHVYVLTLKTTESLAGPLNEWRVKYFPKNLNRTPAHLTLFHALPHSQIETLENSLSLMSASMAPFLVSTGKAFRMRKGVGINVASGHDTVKGVHEQLRCQWLAFLSEQDAGGFRPHWTIMNKINDDKKVENALNMVQNEISARTPAGYAIGLELWEYKYGNWEWANDYPFGTPERTESTMCLPESLNIEGIVRQTGSRKCFQEEARAVETWK